MPTYQYSCTECGHFFEVHQGFSEDSLTVCPTCEGKLRKVFNAVGVVFKGSGFYRNDSRGAQPGSETGSSGNGSESGQKSSPEKGAEKVSATGSEKKTSTESKPAAKSGSASSTPA